MDENTLNSWAAQYMGEEGDELTFSVDSEIYTQSIGAALTLLSAMVEDGCEVELNMSKGGVTVEVDDAEASGSWEDAAKVIVQACYDCKHGVDEEEDEDGDDA